MRKGFIKRSCVITFFFGNNACSIIKPYCIIIKNNLDEELQTSLCERAVTKCYTIYDIIHVKIHKDVFTSSHRSRDDHLLPVTHVDERSGDHRNKNTRYRGARYRSRPHAQRFRQLDHDIARARVR